MTYFLQVQNNAITIKSELETVVVRNIDEYNEWADAACAEYGEDQIEVLHSSTINYPQESTNNAEVIELCRALTAE